MENDHLYEENGISPKSPVPASPETGLLSLTLEADFQSCSAKLVSTLVANSLARLTFIHLPKALFYILLQSKRHISVASCIPSLFLFFLMSN